MKNFYEELINDSTGGHHLFDPMIKDNAVCDTWEDMVYIIKDALEFIAEERNNENKPTNRALNACRLEKKLSTDHEYEKAFGEYWLSRLAEMKKYWESND